VTEILNYISAWLTFLAAVFTLCVFFFGLASKKNPLQPGLNIKDSWFNRAVNKKKSFLVHARLFLLPARSEIWR
jgi:hypothetical protein